MIEFVLTSVFVNIVWGWLMKLLPEHVVTGLLFDGKLRDQHKTKYAFNELAERHKQSIKAFNRAILLSIGFSAVAMYVYFVLPADATVEVQFIGLSVTRQVWIYVAPVISYGLQTLSFATFCWFMLLRLGVKLLTRERGTEEEFGDVANIVLNGILGHIWLIFRIGNLVRLWSYLWYLPLLVLLVIVVLSPTLVCLFFIIQLFIAGSFALGVTYSVFFVPFAIISLLLLGTTAILGYGERYL